MEKYSWEFNEDAELWGNDTHDSIEECIAEAEETAKENEEEYDTVYIGENIPFTPYVDAESVLDNIMEQASEFAGEAGNDWDAYDFHRRTEIDELSESLTSVVNEWLKKYGRTPCFYAVECIRRYPLNMEDKNNA